MSIEVVIASQGQDLAWLRQVPFDARFTLHVYDKSGNQEHAIGVEDLLQSLQRDRGCAWELKQLPDLGGSHAHTFLYHIASKYHAWEAQSEKLQNRAEDMQHVVVFIQADLTQHLEAFGARDAPTLLSMLVQDAVLNGCSKSFAVQVPDGAEDNFREFSSWFVTSGVAPVCPKTVVSWPGGMFAAPSVTLLNRPESEYTAWLESAAARPEVGHFIARAWCYIVDAAPIDYALIPFADRVEDPDPQERERARKALAMTVRSACRITRKRVLIGVSTQHDADFVVEEFSSKNPFVVPFRTPDLPDQTSLNVLFCSCIQQVRYDDTDVICYMEPHNVICGKDIPGHVRRLMAAPVGAYLAPHRCEEEPEWVDVAADGRVRATFQGHSFVLPNTEPDAVASFESRSRYYTASGVVAAYGGAFIMPYKAFRSVLFTLHHDMPPESACFSPFYHYGFKCMKTRDPQGLCVISMKKRMIDLDPGALAVASMRRMT